MPRVQAVSDSELVDTTSLADAPAVLLWAMHRHRSLLDDVETTALDAEFGRRGLDVTNMLAHTVEPK